jgi:hypothetical protein
VATQPAWWTPRAQTIALDSIVLNAMKPAASDSEMIKCLIAVLLGSKPYLPFRNRLVVRAGTASPKLGRGD